RPIDVDAGAARSVNAVLTEAGDAAACAAAAVAGADRIPERTLALAAPHQAVDVVRAQVILDQTQPEVACVRVAGAGRRRGHARHDDFTRAIETRNVCGNDVLEPADHFHLPLVRPRQH